MAAKRILVKHMLVNYMGEFSDWGMMEAAQFHPRRNRSIHSSRGI
jgi:hypothetical protein